MFYYMTLRSHIQSAERKDERAKKEIKRLCLTILTTVASRNPARQGSAEKKKTNVNIGLMISLCFFLQWTLHFWPPPTITWFMACEKLPTTLCFRMVTTNNLWDANDGFYSSLSLRIFGFRSWPYRDEMFCNFENSNTTDLVCDWCLGWACLWQCVGSKL